MGDGGGKNKGDIVAGAAPACLTVSSAWEESLDDPAEVKAGSPATSDGCGRQAASPLQSAADGLRPEPAPRTDNSRSSLWDFNGERIAALSIAYALND